VIQPSADLIGDLLDIGGFSPQVPANYNSSMQPSSSDALDLLGDGLDNLIGNGGGLSAEAATTPTGMGKILA